MEYNQALEFFIENGIQLNRDQMNELRNIYNEGFFSKSKLKKSQKKTNDNDSDTNIMKYTAEKVTGSKFDYLYNSEAMCAEGLENADKDEVHKQFAEYISKEWTDVNHNKTIKFYYCTGKDVNDYYHLTGDNKYKNYMKFFFIDCKELGSYEHKGNFRWFSDVIDNNARREIRAGNPHYKNYHSLYGDEWFYSTI